MPSLLVSEVKAGLLRWNYFPNQKRNAEELPPIFTSKNLVPSVAVKLEALTSRQGGYDQVEYLATRYNNVSRALSIPHPTAYCHLVREITDNWSDINFIEDNENSRIKPASHADGRIIIMDYGDEYSNSERALKFGFGKKFRAHTDISNCFPSVYSHSIPWALVTPAVAKTTRGASVWFNKIDFSCRQLKRGETQGVCIGPATSNVLSEIILTRVDERLRSKYSYHRFIDDYICYTDTDEEAQAFIRDLRDTLKEFKLSINIKKTQIVRLPTPIEADWIVDLATKKPNGTLNIPPKTGVSYGPSEAVRYIDYAVRLNEETPDGSVLKFAVKSILYRLDGFAKVQVLEYLLNLVRHFPTLLPCLDPLFESKSIDPWFYTEHLNTILSENAIERRADGMTWTLYYLNRYKLPICSEVIEKVIETKDCISILSVYMVGKAYQAQVVDFACSLDKSDDYLLDQYWLLMYQLYFWGETIKLGCNTKDFEILKENDVCFIERKNYETKVEKDYELGQLLMDFDLVNDEVL